MHRESKISVGQIALRFEFWWRHVKTNNIWLWTRKVKEPLFPFRLRTSLSRSQRKLSFLHITVHVHPVSAVFTWGFRFKIRKNPYNKEQVTTNFTIFPTSLPLSTYGEFYVKLSALTTMSNTHKLNFPCDFALSHYSWFPVHWKYNAS